MSPTLAPKKTTQSRTAKNLNIFLRQPQHNWNLLLLLNTFDIPKDYIYKIIILDYYTIRVNVSCFADLKLKNIYIHLCTCRIMILFIMHVIFIVSTWNNHFITYKLYLLRLVSLLSHLSGHTHTYFYIYPFLSIPLRNIFVHKQKKFLLLIVLTQFYHSSCFVSFLNYPQKKKTICSIFDVWMFIDVVKNKKLKRNLYVHAILLWKKLLKTYYMSCTIWWIPKNNYQCFFPTYEQCSLI